MLIIKVLSLERAFLLQEFCSELRSWELTIQNNERKVVRGGSWKDVAYFLQVSSRDYEYADSARSYIGFRTVQDYMGTEVTKNAATN